MSERLDNFCEKQTVCKQSIWDWFRKFWHIVSNFAVKCCCNNKIMQVREEERVTAEDTSLCERREVDECGMGSHYGRELIITKEELIQACKVVDCGVLGKFKEGGGFDGGEWIHFKKDIAECIQNVYHKAFVLSRGHHFESEPVLADLRCLLIGELAELLVAQLGSEKRDIVGENSVLG